MTLSAAASLALPCCSTAKFWTDSAKLRPRFPNAVKISAFGGDLTFQRRSCSELTKSSTEDRSSVHSLKAWGSVKRFRRRRNGEGRLPNSTGGGLDVRATAEKEVVKSKGLSQDGPGKGGQWLSSTTRHVRIYIGVADPVTSAMDQTQLDKVTLMLDPDDEFVWPEDKVQKVYDYFAELVAGYAGAPCTEYTLRLIGSDVEHYIRQLLLKNEIKYNLDCRVLNFSMGKPRYESGAIEDGED